MVTIVRYNIYKIYNDQLSRISNMKNLRGKVSRIMQLQVDMYCIINSIKI